MTNLNLSTNKFGSRGCACLERLLKINTTLQKLDISYNMLGFEPIHRLRSSADHRRTGGGGGGSGGGSGGSGDGDASKTHPFPSKMTLVMEGNFVYGGWRP